MPESEQTVPTGTPENEIERIDLVRLNNAAHLLFVQDVHKTAAAETGILANPIAKAAIDMLGAAAEEEDRCLVLSQKSLLTKRIVAADRQRDEMYMGYRAAVSGFLRSPDQGMAEASERLWAHLTDYRITISLQFETETSLIGNLVKDCEAKYAADVIKLGVKAYVDALKAANEKVHDLLLDRTHDRSKQAAGALRAARRASDVAYTRVVKVVNALAILNNDTAKCDAFIKFMNTQIKRYKEQVLTSKKRDKDDKDPKNPKDPKDPKDPKPTPDPKPKPDPKPTPDPKPKPDPKPTPDPKPKPKPGDDEGDDVYIPSV